jgi:hypothetical protein
MHSGYLLRLKPEDKPEKRYGGEDDLSDFEFLYNEIHRVALSRDPSFKIPETLTHYVPDK